jgi:RNA polymerase sigma factor (sigma-70 family)
MQDIEKIYKEYFETVYKYLFCLTHNSDLAEELTQETFYKAVQKIDSFKGKCKISVWLCQIAKNLWYDELKKEQRINKSGEEELSFIASNENLEEMIVSNEERISLYQKMQKLDNVTREVIYLRITGELSFKEIGNILNKTENWARVTFYRGKNKMREVEDDE